MNKPIEELTKQHFDQIKLSQKELYQLSGQRQRELEQHYNKAVLYISVLTSLFILLGLYAYGEMVDYHQNAVSKESLLPSSTSTSQPYYTSDN